MHPLSIRRQHQITGFLITSFAKFFIQVFFATPESTFTVPNYNVGKIKEKEKIFLETRKNVTPQKLTRFKQSYLKALYEILDSNLTALNYRIGNLNFVNYFVI